MSTHSIILVGAGGHSISCIDVVEQAGNYSILGLVGQPKEKGTNLLGYTVLGNDDELPKMREKAANALVAVGQITKPEPRMSLFHKLKMIGYKLPAIISPRSYVSGHAEIGEGTIIMHGAIVNAGAKIGRNCIINSHALIEHGVSIGDHCHISTSSVLNGDVRVDEGSFVGSGTNVREGISIGRFSVIGMGLTIRHDQLEQSRITSNT